MRAVAKYPEDEPTTADHVASTREPEPTLEPKKAKIPNPVKDLTIPVERIPELRFVAKDGVSLFQLDGHMVAGDYRLRYVGKIKG